MRSGLEIYSHLKKMSDRKLNATEEKHSLSRERFSVSINHNTTKLAEIEKKYEDAVERAIAVRSTSIEMAVSEALEARLLRCEILAYTSSLALLRMNEFFHNAMITMARDVRLGIEYEQSKLDTLFPRELKKPVLDSLKSMRMDDMFEPIIDEITADSNQEERQ